MVPTTPGISLWLLILAVGVALQTGIAIRETRIAVRATGPRRQIWDSFDRFFDRVYDLFGPRDLARRGTSSRQIWDSFDRFFDRVYDLFGPRDLARRATSSRRLIWDSFDRFFDRVHDLFGPRDKV